MTKEIELFYISEKSGIHTAFTFFLSFSDTECPKSLLKISVCLLQPDSKIKPPASDCSLKYRSIGFQSLLLQMVDVGSKVKKC